MKKRKISSFLMILLPFVLCLLAQIYVALIVEQILVVTHPVEWVASNVIYALFITHLTMAVLFGFWYYNIHMDRPDAKIRDAFTVKSIVTIVLYSVGFQIIVGGFFAVAEKLFPAAVENYQMITQSAGLGEITPLVILTAVVLGPIAEECVFRGLTIHYLEKAGAGFLLANLVQALLFGVMHGNLMQGIYTFVFGLLLGQIYGKYKSIILCILFHMVFNLLGVTMVIGSDSVAVSIVLFLIGIVTVVVAFLICTKDKTNERPAERIVNSLSSYKAYTRKGYRMIVNFALPLLLIFVGTLSTSVAEIQVQIILAFEVLFIIIDCIGEYFAFGGTLCKGGNSISWMKSSYKGRIFQKNVYGWDIGAKLVKNTIMWVVMGAVPALCGNLIYVLIGYLMHTTMSFVAYNFLRRIDNAQFSMLIITPCAVVAAIVSALLINIPFLTIPGIIVLAVLAILSVVLTYRLSIGAYDKSFHDA